MTKESYFVTSTGTEVGKTIVSGLLVEVLTRTFDQVTYWKPVASGCKESPYGYRSPDEIEIIERTPLSPDDVHSTFRFEAPLSPDKAAEREGESIEPDKVLAHWEELSEEYDGVIVEGIGGVAVPFTPDYDVTQLIQDLRLTPLIVSPSVLGTISYTRTAEYYLADHGRAADGIILTPKKGRSIETTNRNHLQEFYPDKFIDLLPQADEERQHALDVISDYRNHHL